MTDTDARIHAALSEYHALLLTLWGEARGEPIDGIVGVGNVIRNRTREGRGSYRDVVFQPAQFSCWRPIGGAANYAAVMLLARKLTDDHALSTAMPTDPAFKECGWVAEGLIGNRVRDNTRGSNHYLERELFETSPPSWAVGHSPTVRLAGHVFLKL